MNKQYSIIGYTAGTAGEPDSFLGYVAMDSASGGYPYVSTTGTPVLFNSLSFPEHVMLSIRKSELRDMSQGTYYISGDGGLFKDIYRNVTKRPEFEECAIVAHILEYDFEDPLNITVKIIDTVKYKYRLVESFKTRHLGYFEIITE